MLNDTRLFSYFFFATNLFLRLSATVQISDEKPIVAVTCMYNNEAWAEKNLTSIFNQQYCNFRVIVVDDGSTDTTADKIRQTVARHSMTDKTTFICNGERKRKLANLYHALYLVNDNEIVIMIDGDDWLADNSVFSYINRIYKKNVWFTYGQYENIPASQAIAWGFSPKGYAKVIPQETIQAHSYRKGPFYYMHPRTFQGWLFKLVKLKDLISTTVEGFIGDFFPASNDLAMYLPMVEMAHEKIRFIKKILYKRNLFSELVGFKVDRQIQLDAAHEIKKKKPYQPLAKPRYRKYSLQPDEIIHCIIDGHTIPHDQIIAFYFAKKNIPAPHLRYTILMPPGTWPAIISLLEQKIPEAQIQKSSIRLNAQTCCLYPGDYILFINDARPFLNNNLYGDILYQLKKTSATCILFFDHNFAKNRYGLSYTASLTNELSAIKNDFLIESRSSSIAAGYFFKKSKLTKEKIRISEDQSRLIFVTNDNNNVSLLWQSQPTDS